MEVAAAMVGFIDKLEPWVSQNKGLALTGSSIVVLYEGDTTVSEPAPPVVKIIDFMNVSVNSSGKADESYLNGVRILRWNLERLVAWGALEAAKEDTLTGMRELRTAKKQLKSVAAKCESAAQACLAASPEKGRDSHGLLHADIIKEEVDTSVMMAEDNVIASFLKAVLAKHKINPGQDAFVELLKWKYEPLCLDRLYLTDICERYGLNTAACDDILKWKETSDAQLRDMRYIYDVKLSGRDALPSYYALLTKQEDVKGYLGIATSGDI